MAGLDLFLVELKVADWSGTAAWYVEVLGLRPLLRDEPRQYLLLEAGGGRVALKGGATAEAPSDRARLFFRVDDLDLERERLLALGVEVSPVRIDRDERYGEVRLRDPEGTPIRLFRFDGTHG